MEEDKEKWGFNRSDIEIKQIHTADISKTGDFVCKWIGRNVLKIFSL